MNKPIVGITMGDPAGSGPEITIKALADPEQYTYCRPIVVGDVKVFEQARKFVGREDIVIHRCDRVSDALSRRSSSWPWPARWTLPAPTP